MAGITYEKPDLYMTLYNRLQAEVDSDPELDQSKVIRLALKEYFEKRDQHKAQLRELNSHDQ